MYTVTQTFLRNIKSRIYYFFDRVNGAQRAIFYKFHANDHDLIPTIKGDDGL